MAGAAQGRPISAMPNLGPYPLERLRRQEAAPDLARVPPMWPVPFVDEARPEALVNAMARFIGMFDAIRDGAVGPIPEDPLDRANHLKAAAYYFDTT